MQELPKSVAVGLLLSTYGGLLTEKQREALRLHYDEDLSLAEIAEQFHVSRQNVHDLITRSTQQLERYESQLHTLRRTRRMEELLSRALESADFNEIKRLLAQAVAELEGEDNGL